MGKTWLVKWDFTRYNFKDIDDEYKQNKTLGYNYGNILDNTKENLEKFHKESNTEITEDDNIFIYFNNIPGGDNQIFLKLTKLQLKDENGYLVWINKDNKIQKYIDAHNIKWVLDDNDILRFTKGGLIKEGFKIEERPSIQEITDTKLIDVLNDNLKTYSELSNKMKKNGKCFFEELIDKKSNHKTFTRNNNLPYLEQHHFILQEIYRNYKNDNNKEELEKIIYSSDNILLLCPRCHRMIHQGNKEIVNKMLDTIKENNPTLFNNVEKVEKIINESNLIERMYNTQK